MTSVRKIEANRRNSQRSCGPRTAAGKSIASRNALRHGLAAITHCQQLPGPEVEQFARVLCGEDADPVLFASAVQIAQNEITWREIRIQQIHVVERLREPYEVALAKKDNSLDLGLGRFMEGWLAEWEIMKQLPNVLEKYRERIGLAKLPVPADPAPWTKELDLDAETLHFYKVTDWARLGDWDMIVPIALKARVEEEEIDGTILELARKRLNERERDEFEALQAAVLDLIRLSRYERRAWSRQKRAIRDFMSIKVSTLSRGSAAAEEHAA
jgi:hypothetical protein